MPTLVALLASAVALVSLALPASGSAAPYYLGFHEPTARERPGVVLMLHGGGWFGDFGEAADDVMRDYIDDVRDGGWKVYNLGYRSGHFSVWDTLGAVLEVRARHPDEKLCLVGGSAGGHLALLAAAFFQGEIACVVDIGGPPDLETPDTRPLSAWVPALAARMFGAHRLAALSPVTHVDAIRQPVLVVAPDCDVFTSFERQRDFARRLPRGSIVREYGGPGVETGHCSVTTASFERYRFMQRLFLSSHLR